MEYSHVHGRDLYFSTFLAAGRVLADVSWQRALELVAGSRGASPGQDDRWQSTCSIILEFSQEARREVAQA
jgi:hypothetical protein